jgi:hypothetical protein
MRFCPWYPLADGGAHAPASPGMFQVRIAQGLLDYPGGKSAMVHYETADDLRASIVAFATPHVGTGWLCRHTIEMSAEPAEDAQALYARLVADFRARFGSAPRLPNEAGRG